MSQQILFYICAIVSVVAAILAITRKNPVMSIVWLIVCMIGIAVIYVLINAFFLAAVQVIVYAGAVLMLFIFVIMMLNLKTGIIGQMRNIGLKFLGLIAAALLLRQLYVAVRGAGELLSAPENLPAGFGEPAGVGEILFTKYVYPLELIAVLLLVAIVGALVLAGKEEP